MSVTVNVNGLSLCHRLSGGVSRATLPDVCLTPGRGQVPYPNVAFSRDLAKGTTTVTADGADMCANYGSEFARSTGDEPGTDGGVTSGVNMREATWITYSFDVRLEGRGACRLSDKMFHNRWNTVNMGGLFQDYLAKAGGDAAKACEFVLDQIRNLIGERRTGKVDGVRGLEERFQQQIDGGGLGKMGAPNAPPLATSKNGLNSWQNHNGQIKAQQKNLERHLDVYDDECKGGPPPPPANARAWVDRPLPKPSDYRGELYSVDSSAGAGHSFVKGLLITGAVLATVGTVAAYFNPFDGGPIGGTAAAAGTRLLWGAALAF